MHSRVSRCGIGNQLCHYRSTNTVPHSHCDCAILQCRSSRYKQSTPGRNCWPHARSPGHRRHSHISQSLRATRPASLDRHNSSQWPGSGSSRDRKLLKSSSGFLAYGYNIHIEDSSIFKLFFEHGRGQLPVMICACALPIENHNADFVTFSASVRRCLCKIHLDCKRAKKCLQVGTSTDCGS